MKAFLQAGAVVGGLLRDPALPPAWPAPSALPGFRISGLAGHLARAVFNTRTYVSAAPPPPEAPLIDAVTYFTDFTASAGPADDRLIRERGEADAGTGPDDLITRYDAALAQLSEILPGLPADRPVTTGRGDLPLREYLITRLVELVVHADDLAVSLGVPTPGFPPEAADLVVVTLAACARRRHGTVPLVRALARTERAAGPVSAF